jgi:hypothetical protein
MSHARITHTNQAQRRATHESRTRHGLEHTHARKRQRVQPGLREGETETERQRGRGRGREGDLLALVGGRLPPVRSRAALPVMTTCEVSAWFCWYWPVVAPNSDASRSVRQYGNARGGFCGMQGSEGSGGREGREGEGGGEGGGHRTRAHVGEAKEM